MRTLLLFACAAALAACAGVDGSSPSDSTDVGRTTSALGTTYEVGPGKPFADLQSVATRLAPGDTVLVYARSTPYPGDLSLSNAGTAAAKITIRGVRVNGARPVISGGTNTVIFNASHYVMEGFDIAAGGSRNVYHHADDVTIRDTVVHDCVGNGILGADTGSGSLTLEQVEVYKCGAGTSKHPIYMATDEAMYPGSVFRMKWCYLHDQNGGNAVKSRAERNEITYNWIEGATYREIELIGPDNTDTTRAREDSDVVGNVFVKSPTGTYVARIGGDGGNSPTSGRYRFAFNTFVLAPSSPAAIQVFDRVETLELHDNVFYRQGGGGVQVMNTSNAIWVAGHEVSSGTNNWVPSGSTGLPSGVTSTVFGSNPGFVDVASHDLHLATPSALQAAGSATTPSPAGYAFPSPLLAPAYEPPLHTIATPVVRASMTTPSIGVYEAEAASAPPPPPPPPPPPADAGSTAPVCLPAASGFTNSAFATPRTGAFTAQADVTPSGGGVDAALALAKGAQTTWGGLAAIVLFSSGGTIQARNGDTYAAATTVRYAAGATYHVRLAVDVTSHVYSVWVTPPGGTEVQLASGYAFRSAQAAVSSLDTWSVAADAGTLSVCGLTVQ